MEELENVRLKLAPKMGIQEAKKDVQQEFLKRVQKKENIDLDSISSLFTGGKDE